MSLAVGGVGQSTPASKPYWVDVRDFGARADGRTDNTAAFQAAVDFLAARIAATVPNGSRTLGTVFIPAAESAYMVSRPVWVDSPYIEVRGEGQGTRVVCLPLASHPIFIFGIRRKPKTVVGGRWVELVADGKYRPDLYGVLDATAAGAPGVRWGFRSHGETFIQSQVSPFSVGCRSLSGDYSADNWTETKQLTVEFAVEGPDGGPIPPGTVLFGTGIPMGNVSYPFVVYQREATFFGINFDTQDQPFADHQANVVWFPSAPGGGLQRVTIQFDLTLGIVCAFVNGVQVQVSGGYNAGWGPGKSFAENDYYPFLVADAGGNRPAVGGLNNYDFSLYGLLYSRGLRYLNRGVGQAQARADDPSRSINDAYRYFTPRFDDPGLMGYLTFEENPASGGRFLEVRGGNACGYASGSAFLFHSLMISEGGILDNGIHDMTLIGANLFGQNVAVGQVLDMSITGIRSTGAYHAIGSLANSANYNVRVENCHLDATDSGYFGLNQGVWMRNVHFIGAGRATMRFAGCVVTAENCFVAFWAPNNQSTIKMHWSDYGGNYSFKNLVVDYEGDSYRHTAIYCEAHPYASSTSLRLTDVYIGTVGDADLIILKDGKSWYPPAYLTVDNLQAFTNKFKSVLALEGPKWRGEINGLSVGDGPRVRHTEKNGVGSGVAIREPAPKSLPRSGYWCSGAHRLEVAAPADGQYGLWKCVRSGRYGTSAPPVWAGSEVTVVGPDALAGYVFNHAYITASLT